ncbi:MAG: DUF1848 domain-containing protein [Proteobacteria bacterium]|jgi:hypothetical protein|nr:DUF1848 domain-containing protein [Pseudomonadota bacterium]
MGQPEKSGRPLILSASRRTDLPGFHAETCASRIRGRVARSRTRPLYGVVFWTRHLAPFLRGGALHDLVRLELANPIVNLTITGLGGGRLEPATPSVDAAIDALPALVGAFHDEPWRVRWRFDPILAGHSRLEDFARIAAAMSALGVTTCTFSFPSYRSLKGDLAPQFEAAGIPRWREEEKPAFVRSMVEIARPLGIALLSCAQPDNLSLSPYVQPAQCVPADILAHGHPHGEPCTLGRDRSQRTHCLCVESEEIGRYDDVCLGGCAYCYSKASTGARQSTFTG